MSALRSLPLPFTSLVGREQDIVKIANLLTAPGSIVTLVGPAGVGKTRLAIAVAHQVEGAFADGAVYVDLTGLTQPEQVLPAIVNALGLPVGDGAQAQLAAHLSVRSLVLILDNFEQVLDAGPALNASLAGAPGARALVTSQAPLRVRGEREIAVEPLALPPDSGREVVSAETLHDIGRIPAVQLFVDRARGVRPGFALTEGNLAAVTAICRALDGLPLAIELAAARSNVLSPEALLSRLSGSLQLLSGGPRDAPDRHQALRAAIEWSYNLLSSQEALLLDRLSVFAGTFSLTAAEAIAGNAPIVFAPSIYVDATASITVDDDRLEWSDVFELLDRLVDHSLVQRAESAGDEPRFRLLQTIRQVAAIKLAERGDYERTAWRHAVWFHTIAESAWTRNGVPELESLWLDRLERDNDNLRAALDHLATIDPAIERTMASALVWFYYIRGRRLEGVRAMQRPLATFDPNRMKPEARARADFALGNLLALFAPTRQEGARYLENVLVDLRALGHEWGVGYTLLSLAVLAEDDGEYERALEFIDAGEPLLVAVDDAPTLANVAFHRAVNHFGLGELVQARAIVTPVANGRKSEAGLNIAYARHLLGLIELVEGNPRLAARHVRAALDFSLQHGMVGTATELIDAAATMLATEGDYEMVMRLFGAADRLNRETSNLITVPEVTYYDAARRRARTSLGEKRTAELLAEGATLSLETGFALARDALNRVARSSAPKTELSPTAPATTMLGLSKREVEVLRLVALGLSDREIGDRLFISHGTARTHVRNILVKLDVHSRAAATTIALREGMVSSLDQPA